eukprot:m.147864 g.147864  ORF g.147864 m.147864 type:complete len:587 (+) comp30565_c0_seq1:106-1866(+)
MVNVRVRVPAKIPFGMALVIAMFPRGSTMASSSSPPLPKLLNNSRLDWPGYTPPTFICATAEQCLAACVNDSKCGGITFMTPYEPIPVPRPGCAGQRPGIDGCCYPAPVLDRYQVIPPGQPVTYGFVAAIVRYGPPVPPPGIPSTWKPTYEMNKSISLYWRNATGIEPPENFDGYGLVMFDWAMGAQQWINDYAPMDNGIVLAKQCEVIKARNNNTKCIVYRNSVIALNQYKHISSVLDDPSYTDFFLKFKANATQTGKCWGEVDPRQGHGPWDPIWPTPVVCEALTPTDVHTPFCDKAQPSKCNSVHYFDQNQCPQVPGDNWSNDSKKVYQGLSCNGPSCNCGASPCGEYLFNFTNPDMVDWWLLEHMGGETALDHPDVDGVITDDYWNGPPSEIDSHSLEDMGFTESDTKAINADYNTAMARLKTMTAERNKFISIMGYNGDSISNTNSQQCISKLTSMCDNNSTGPVFGSWYAVEYNYVQPPVYGIKDTNAVMDVAYFLLTRGPWAWIGGGSMLGWHMSHWWTANQTRRIQFQIDLRPPAFNDDYGTPTSSCAQTTPGVFTRDWSEALITVNCNTLEGTIGKK